VARNVVFQVEGIVDVADAGHGGRIRQTDKPTNRQTDKPTNRQTDKPTNKQSRKQANRGLA
jgi:hypothetical protein